MQKKDLVIADEQIVEELDKLPADYWDFKSEDTRELTHGIHTYPAVMIYPISRNIIKTVMKHQTVETLMDPFMGSGTVLVEGILAGLKKVYGTDLNPLARLISSVKTKHLKSEVLKQSINEFMSSLDEQYIQFNNLFEKVEYYIRKEKRLDVTAKEGWGNHAPAYLAEFLKLNDAIFEIPEFYNIGYWFLPKVIIELQIIKNCIRKVKNQDIKDFLWVAFSETVRIVSNRRNGEFKMFRMPPEKLTSYNPETKSEFLRILNRNTDKMQGFYTICDKKVKDTEIYIFAEDTRYLNNIPDNSIDLMITSPPYGDSRTTVAYGEFSRVSLQWIDMYDVSNREIMDMDKNLMGGTKFRNGFANGLKSQTLSTSLKRIREIDEVRAGDVYSFYKDLDICLCSITKKMRINSYQFWVVGNRTVKLENLKTNTIIEELGQQYGLIPVYTINRNIPNKVMPSLNSPSNVIGDKVTTMTNEHILVLRKAK